jgi:serine/threonine-protein kinase RsbW
MREYLSLQQKVEEGGRVELRIPSRAEWVGVARLAVAGIASRLHFSIEDIEDLKLAVAEACTNCIQHAAESDSVAITCQMFSDKIVIVVEDHGRSATAGELAPRRLGEPQVGGLGIFLIRSLMDDVEYELNPETGTRLTMTKFLRT